MSIGRIKRDIPEKVLKLCEKAISEGRELQSRLNFYAKKQKNKSENMGRITRKAFQYYVFQKTGNI